MKNGSKKILLWCWIRSKIYDFCRENVEEFVYQNEWVQLQWIDDGLK